MPDLEILVWYTFFNLLISSTTIVLHNSSCDMLFVGTSFLTSVSFSLELCNVFNCITTKSMSSKSWYTVCITSGLFAVAPRAAANANVCSSAIQDFSFRLLATS